MIKLFIKESVDKFDERFGEPTMEVLTIDRMIKFLDDVIRFPNDSGVTLEGLNDKYNFKVDRIVATKLFEQAVKLLWKKKKLDVLRELRDTVIKLGNYEISSNKDNHPLKNAEGHLDLHLDGGNLILVYKYLSEKLVEVDIDKESIIKSLRLQDIVNHKELDRYNKKKYKKSAEEINIDDIFKMLDNN